MVTIGIKLLKNKLSEYIRLVEAGETVLVTDRGRVVAELTAPQPERARMVSDAVLAEAMRKGWMYAPVDRDTPLPPRKPVMTFEEMMVGLDEDRADRF